MTVARPSAAGVAIIDTRGVLAYASGVGSDPRIAALLQDPGWLADARVRRLVTIKFARRQLAGILVPFDGGHLLALHQPEQADVVLEFLGTVDFAYDIFRQLLTDPFDALTVVDHDAKVAFISPIHESFFGLKRGEAVGRPVRQVIENTRLHEVVTTGKAEVGVIQRMSGRDRVVTRRPIVRSGRIVGAMGRVMFKGPEQLDALSRRINALEGEVEFYRREAEALRRQSYDFNDIVGSSAAIDRVRMDILKVAPLDMPILITGQSGTGKELVAQALHRLSGRSTGPIVPVNAAALPASLVESELFGYEAGAFTGADRKGRRGKFEQASGGTLFLDEIGDMPLDVQAKLLRVLQDGVIERVGSDKPRAVDFRLVTATNHSLPKLVESGRFRLDLYYRLSAITLTLPPLSQRLSDVPMLVDRFVDEFCQRHRRPRPIVEPSAIDRLMRHAWPGNVRELRHAVERAIVFAEAGRLTAADFDRSFGDIDPGEADPPAHRLAEPADAMPPARPLPPADASVRDVLGRVQDDMIRRAMSRLNGNKKRVAAELGISRSFLYKRLEQMGAQG